jgi:hypothetical protein
MKRLILLLALALAATACGSDSDDTNADGDTTTTEASDAEASETTEAGDETTTTAALDDAKSEGTSKSGKSRSDSKDDEYLVDLVDENVTRLNDIPIDEAENLDEEELLGTFNDFDDQAFDQQTDDLGCDQADLFEDVCAGFEEIEAETRTAEIMIDSIVESTCSSPGGTTSDTTGDATEEASVELPDPADVEVSTEFCDVVRTLDVELDPDDPSSVATAFRDIAEVAPDEVYDQFDVVATTAEAVSSGASGPPAGITQSQFAEALDFTSAVMEEQCGIQM